jgi:hypothetical protein
MSDSEPEKLFHEDNPTTSDKIYHNSESENSKQINKHQKHFSIGNNLNNDANVNDSLKEQREYLFKQIEINFKANVDENIIKGWKTKKGKTQEGEETTITIVRKTLITMGLTFQEAGSQQSRDFRNVGGIGLDLEIKKTDGLHIYFNDTLPNSNIYYIIFFTGQEKKRQTSIPPQIIYLNGNEFIKDSKDWIYSYQEEINKLKDKYGRGELKKALNGIMSVYPRPTYKADIRSFLKME